MLLYTNIKLHGEELIGNQMKDYNKDDFDLSEMINTWKYWRYKKNKHKHTNDTHVNDIALSLAKMIRYENMMWRHWFMKNKNKSKIPFLAGTDDHCTLRGPTIMRTDNNEDRQ
jgi:hypothetical protein